MKPVPYTIAAFRCQLFPGLKMVSRSTGAVMYLEGPPGHERLIIEERAPSCSIHSFPICDCCREVHTEDFPVEFTTSDWLEETSE
jgi:hypothetical protein